MINSNLRDNFVPELWAQEGVNILWENMVYANLVHRDYSSTIASYGETVKTRKVAEMKSRRKQNDEDEIVSSRPQATEIEVVLNQRIYTSFYVPDGAMTLAFKDLIQEFMTPAMMAQARILDRIVGAQMVHFLGNNAGGLGQMTKDNSHDYLMDMRNVFNKNKVPEDNRRIGLAPNSETFLQKNLLFKSAEQIGDNGTALRQASLGRLGSWDLFLELNTPYAFSSGNAASSTTAAANIAVGATTFNVASGAALAVGQYISIVGDYSPLKVIAIATNTITVNRPISRPVTSGAAITKFTQGAVDQGSAIAAGDAYAGVANGYPAGWLDYIEVDGSGTAAVGQLVSFGTTDLHEYVIVEIEGDGILLDRPLATTMADNAVVNYGPDGDYNFAFRRNALALVSRPLIIPPDANAGIGMANDFAVRVEFSRNSTVQKTLVTIDALYGVAVLDSAQGGVLLG